LENYSWLSFFVFYGQPSSRVKEWEIVIRRAEGLRKVEARIVSSDDFLDKSKAKTFDFGTWPPQFLAHRNHSGASVVRPVSTILSQFLSLEK
jgi:hypothetical protein